MSILAPRRSSCGGSRWQGRGGEARPRRCRAPARKCYAGAVELGCRSGGYGVEKSRGVAGRLKKAIGNLGVRSKKESGRDCGRDARAGEADRIPAMRDPDSERGF